MSDVTSIEGKTGLEVAQEISDRDGVPLDVAMAIVQFLLQEPLNAISNGLAVFGKLIGVGETRH